MALSCLSNLVGVRGCGTDTYLRYVNDLTGINVPDFDKAISVEKQSASAALQDLITIAKEEVIQEVNTHLSGKYQIKSLIENGTVGYYYDNKELQDAQAGVLVGYEVRVDQVPYLSFYLSSLKLFINYTGNVSVVVYDLTQGKLLDTIIVTAVAGEIVTVNVDKEYFTNKQRMRLFVGYLSTHQSYKTSYTSPYTADGEDCNTCSGKGYSESYIYFRAAQISNSSAKIAENLSSNTTSGGAGLSLNYSLQCSFGEHLCNVKNLLSLPVLYKAGQFIMRELKHSRRLTGVVTVYGNNHDELMKEYEASYNKHMANLLLNSNIPNSICFSCTPKVKSVVNLP